MRIAGLPVDESRLPAGAATAQKQRLDEARATVARCKGPVCDAIAALVPMAFEADAARARSLLGIKRDVHNGRLPRQDAVESCREFFTDSLYGELAALVSAIANVADAEAAYRSAYLRETSEGIDLALAAVMHDDVFGAIEVTNVEVYKRLLAVARNPKSLSEKARAQTMMSATRYVLRAGQKTSPLSSMGVVALGDAHAPAESEIGGALVRRREPSHAALDHVLDAALSKFASIDGNARVGLNTSIVEDQQRYEWRRVESASARHRVRQTAITNVASSSSFLVALSRVVSHHGGVLTLDRLRQGLAPLSQSIGETETEALLADAWEKGFLVPAISTAGEPLDIAMRRASLLSPEPSLRIKSRLQHYADSARDPERPLADTVQAMNMLFAEVDREHEAAEVRPVLFEDCAIAGCTNAATPQIGDSVRHALECMVQLSPILCCDSPMTRMRRYMIEAFKASHGSGGSCLESRAFLRQTAEQLRIVFDRPPAERDDIFTAAREASPLHAQAFRARNQCLDALAQCAGPEAHVIVPSALMHAAIDAFPLAGAPKMISQIFFLQAVPGDPSADFVLNNIYPGGASTFSRFIAPDSEELEKISAYLHEISRPAELVEISGTFGFNAASHPCFSRTGVSVPPFMSPADTSIDVGRLGLRHRPESDDLVFHDPTLGDIAVHFAAILNPLTLPLDFQIVRSLSPFGELITDIGDQILRRIAPAADGSWTLPRMIYERLVLARARQIIPRALLPDAALEPLAFFTAFNEWADGRGLPRFLFASRRRAGRGDSDGPSTDRQSDMRPIKPLPLDRSSPLAVLLLQKEIASSHAPIAFVEALPNADQTVVTRHGRACVSEYALEITMLGENGGGDVMGSPAKGG